MRREKRSQKERRWEEMRQEVKHLRKLDKIKGKKLNVKCKKVRNKKMEIRHEVKRSEKMRLEETRREEMRQEQWWSVTKYNYFVTVLKYIFQVSVLYWSSFILSNFYFVLWFFSMNLFNRFANRHKRFIHELQWSDCSCSRVENSLIQMIRLERVFFSELNHE